ncbi:MAG: peptidase [Actinomycetota bacterium]|nr:MAG: peptidase [Actinomycetota bacterium]
MPDGIVQVSAFQRSDRSLAGFVMAGRWPESTREWAQFLAVAVRIAALPGLLATTAVFRADDVLPDEPSGDVVGRVTWAGPIVGDGAAQPGQFAEPQPSALVVLHPPSETAPSTPEVLGAASGCVLLPGVPHLGLEHRAAWVEAEPDGTVTRLVSAVGVNPFADPDLAVLATLCAA